MTNFRIRGRLDLALARLIQRETDFHLVQPNKEQVQVFNSESDRTPPDVDISESKHGFIQRIQGKVLDVWAVEEAFRTLCDEAIIHRHPLELHSIYNGYVKHVNENKNLTIIGIGDDIDCILFDTSFRRGAAVMVQIDALDFDHSRLPRCSTRVNLSGKYCVLEFGGNHVRVSRSLPQEKRDELHKLGRELRPSQFGIILRTSAADADLKAIEDEILSLSERGDDILQDISDLEGSAGKVTEGIAVSHVYLTKSCLDKLTAIRNELLPTLPGYYFFRTYSKDISLSLDFANSLIGETYPAELLSEKLKEIMIQRDFQDDSHVRLMLLNIGGEPSHTIHGQMRWFNEKIIEIHKSIRGDSDDVLLPGNINPGLGGYMKIYTGEGAWNLHIRVYSRDDEVLAEGFSLITPLEIGDGQILRALDTECKLEWIQGDEELTSSGENKITESLERKEISEKLHNKILSVKDQIIELYSGSSSKDPVIIFD